VVVTGGSMQLTQPREEGRGGEAAAGQERPVVSGAYAGEEPREHNAPQSHPDALTDQFEAAEVAGKGAVAPGVAKTPLAAPKASALCTGERRKHLGSKWVILEPN
jgi:hypothetical protein